MRTLPPTYGCPVSTTTPTPTTSSRPAATLAVVVVLAAVAWGGIAATTSPARAVPSTVLPAPTATGADVVIEPPVVRAPDGLAELDVVLGSDAADDVVIELSARQPDVAADGTVTAGGTAEDVQVSNGARLRPGERLRVQVTTAGDPVVVVARVHATTTGVTDDPGAGDDGADQDAAGDDPVEVAALVLPGAPGPAPEATLEVTDGRLIGTVTATSPLLVTARLTGTERTTHPDRLVLPSQPLVLEGSPARWPSPSVLTVTDETGRTVTTDTGRTALVVIAATLLAIALAGAAVAVRNHRRRTDDMETR